MIIPQPKNKENIFNEHIYIYIVILNIKVTWKIGSLSVEE